MAVPVNDPQEHRHLPPLFSRIAPSIPLAALSAEMEDPRPDTPSHVSHIPGLSHSHHPSPLASGSESQVQTSAYATPTGRLEGEEPGEAAGAGSGAGTGTGDEPPPRPPIHRAHSDNWDPKADPYTGLYLHASSWHGRMLDWWNAHTKKMGATVSNWKVVKMLPLWLQTGLVDERKWKNWSRIMVAHFVATVLMVDSKVLPHIGNATYFLNVSMEMFPAIQPVAFYVLGMVLMGLGSLFMWAYGAAAFATAILARSDTRYATQLHNWQATLPPGISEADYKEKMKRAIYDATFLDPRSSAVFGVYLFFGAYFLGWIRATRPKLILFFVMGCSILALFSTFGPLFPTKNYTIAKMLLKPLGAGFAISLSCSILIWPQSLNNLVLDILTNKAIKCLRGLIRLQDELLQTSPRDGKAFDEVVAKATVLKSGFLECEAGVATFSSLLQLEVSRGRTSPSQLQRLFKETKELGSRVLALGNLTSMIKDYHDHMAAWRDKRGRVMEEAEKRIDDAERLLEISGKSLNELLPGIAESTSDLRKAIDRSLSHATDFLNMINATRWPWWKPSPDFPPQEARQASLQHLKNTLQEFRSVRALTVLAPFKDMFDPETGRMKTGDRTQMALSVRALFRCFAFTSSLIALALHLVTFLELVEEIETENPVPRFHFPVFARIKSAITKNLTDNGKKDTGYNFRVQEDLLDNGQEHDIDTDSDTYGSGEETEDDVATSNQEKQERPSRPSDVTDTTAVEAPSEKGDKGSKDNNGSKKKKRTKRRFFKKPQIKWKRDPDAGPPGNIIQKTCRLLRAGWRKAWGPSGFFALRFALISVAIFSIAVAPESARFFFHNRGLWALIVAQTGMGVYEGEMMWSFMMRMTGTAAGVVIGIVVWYTGNGHGRGNPYGYPAALMVFIAPLLFLRVCCPKAQIGHFTMLPVTVFFVTGYSWDDNHLDMSANQGVGASMAGRRGLLVLIGFGFSCVAGMLPPIASRKLVREGLSQNIRTLGEIYGLGIAAFEMGREKEDGDLVEHHQEYRDTYSEAFVRLLSIRAKMGYTRWEPSMMGPWPKHVYNALLKAQSEMLGYSSILSNVFMQLSPKWCKLLTDTSNIFNPAFTADVFSLFALLRHALRTGSALPPIIPIFERLELHRAARVAAAPLQAAPLRPKPHVVPSHHSHHSHHSHSHSHARHRHPIRHPSHSSSLSGPHTPHTPMTPNGAGMGAGVGVGVGAGGTPRPRLTVRPSFGSYLSPLAAGHSTPSLSAASGSIRSHSSHRSRHTSSLSHSSAHSRPESQSTREELEAEDVEAQLDAVERSDKALLDTLQRLVTWELLKDDQFAIVATALVAQVQILAGLDTLHRHILELVGEKEVEAFDLTQMRWESGDFV